MNIAFFSYKGGCGRSLIMLGSSVECARMYGTKIGLVDADIEAGTLHYTLGIQPDEDSNFVDVLFRGITAQSVLRKRTIRVKAKIQKDKTSQIKDGELFLYPTLPDKPTEIKIPKIQFDTTTQDICEDFLENFSAANGLGHIFIDCRTGFSRLGGMFLNLADLVVLVFRIDRQNLAGVKMMIARANKRKKALLLVANMIPEGPLGITKLADFQDNIGQKMDVAINYDPRLSFGDIVAPLEYPESDPINISHRKIAEKIQKGCLDESESTI